MRDANRLLLTLAAGAALAACGPQPSDQNAAAANDAAPPTVEALPPDESVEPSADELANGSEAPAADDADNSATNGY